MTGLHSGEAYEYTESGYVCVRATAVNIDTMCHVVINIVDTGIGISEKLLPTIFEPFTLGDDSAIREYAGTGLGLTITKQYVEYLGGRISYESTESVGTRCNIEIHIAHDAEKSNFENSSHLLPAVLISPNRLEEDEIAAFKVAGWHCEVKSGLNYRDISTKNPCVVFIYDCFEDHQDAIISKLLKIYPRSLLIRYATDESQYFPERLTYNSTVRAGNSKDLGMVWRVAIAANLGGQHALVKAVVAPDLSLEILVADDNSANLKTALLVLESVGHTVSTVTNGEAALNELETNKYDIALVDMHMPGMSGIEAAKFYQFSFPRNSTPIVILTADATSNARLNAEEAGAVAFLVKPLRADELRAAVFRYSKKRDSPPISKSAHSSIGAASAQLLPSRLIDTRELDELKSLGINRDELREMILEFEEDSKRIIESSLDAIMRKDISSMKEFMHVLKGSSATVGATLLQLRAQQLEDCRFQDVENNFEERHKSILMILERSVNALLLEIDRETAG